MAMPLAGTVCLVQLMNSDSTRKKIVRPNCVFKLILKIDEFFQFLVLITCGGGGEEREIPSPMLPSCATTAHETKSFFYLFFLM